MSGHPDLSVIVPTYNNRSMLAACLTSMGVQVFDRNAVEIIVVDDGTPGFDPEGLAPLCAPFSLEVISHEVNRGPAAAVYLWAAGEGWDKILELSEWDQGDLASLLFRTADNLRQIANLRDTHPQLAICAQRAVEMIFRPPVVVPT